MNSLLELELAGYGGLKKRYKVHRGGLHECMDPLSVATVSHGTELQFENYLLHWLDPAIQSLDYSLQPWECLDAGQRRTFKPHLVVRRRGAVELQLVCRTETDLKAGLKHSHERVAKAHGAVFVLRTRAEIRASVPKLEHLKRLRQRATAVLHRPLDGLPQQALDLLAAGPLRLADLRAQLGHDAQNHELDAALVKLCREGLVSLNLLETRYEDITVQVHACRPC